jgi:Arc/MetJ family transcription regulator
MSVEVLVRTTIALDDDLVREAQRLSGITEKGALVRQGLRALIERECPPPGLDGR